MRVLSPIFKRGDGSVRHAIFPSLVKVSLLPLLVLFELAAFGGVSLSATALAKNDSWVGCRSANLDARIASCTKLIADRSREAKGNLITAYMNRGAAYRAKGDFDRALADFDTALRLDPQSVRARTERAAIYHAKGEFDRAIADYDAAIAAQSKLRRLSMAGGGLRAKNDLDRAIADYDKALQLDKNLSRAYGGRARAYRGKGDFDKALADFDEALKRDPLSASTYVERGAIYQAKGDLDRAIADYDAAIKIDLNSASAFLSRANAYRSKNELVRAKQDLESALRLDPQITGAKDALDEVIRLIAESAKPPTAASPTPPPAPETSPNFAWASGARCFARIICINSQKPFLETSRHAPFLWGRSTCSRPRRISCRSQSARAWRSLYEGRIQSRWPGSDRGRHTPEESWAQPRRPRKQANHPPRTVEPRSKSIKRIAADLGDCFLFFGGRPRRRRHRLYGGPCDHNRFYPRTSIERGSGPTAGHGPHHCKRQAKAMLMRKTPSQKFQSNSSSPGDIVRLSAGDIIPADLRLIEADDLFINQSTLTGEAMPVEKYAHASTSDCNDPFDLPNICFMGANVVSGYGTGVILRTGPKTFFGQLAEQIAGQRVPTAFDQGINKFTYLMIRFILVMGPTVFLINGLTKHDWLEALLFAVAVAVGLTPEMLPMIVTVNLAKGAIAMSRKKVIVKRLNAIQNFGAMDVLCTDKTGTLTQDRIILKRHLDIYGEDSDRVLEYAYLNSHFQSGLKNLLDVAVLQHAEVEDALRPRHRFTKIDEIPFDFERRRLSVVVQREDGQHLLICKGAVEELFSISIRL